MDVNIGILVEPDKFLFDYKIFIISCVMLIISIIVFNKNKKNGILSMISILASTIIYIILRIIETKKYSYVYVFETNTSLEYVVPFLLSICGCFIILKIIDLLKRKRMN